MIDRSLLLLVVLRLRGAVRKVIRKIRTPKGVVASTIGAVMVLAWLGSFILPSLTGPRSAASMEGADPRVLAPAYLLLALLVIVPAGAAKILAFKPGEVSLLLPGPYSTRQLLVYRALWAHLGAIPGFVLLAIVGHRHAGSVVGSLVAIPLLGSTFIMLQLTFALVTPMVSRLAMWAATGGVIVMVAGALALGVAQVRAGEPPWTVTMYVEAFRHTWVGAAGTAPLAPFATLYFTPSLAIGALSLTIGVWMLTCTLAMLCDHALPEAAMQCSEREQRRRTRVSSGSFWEVSSRRAHRAMPAPRWLWGAGPLAWRQMSALLRSAAIWAIVIICLGTLVLPLLVEQRKPLSIGLGIFLGAGSLLVLPALLPFDFRQDLDRIAGFKTLPMTEVRIALGQLLVPTATMTCMLWVGIVGLSWHAALEPSLAAALMVLVPGACLVIVSIENAVFLWFPSRSHGSTGFDVSTIGRQTILLLFKLVMLGGVGLVGVLLALGVWKLTDEPAISVLSAVIPVLAADAIGVWMVSRAFGAFDVATDIPA